jgi:hypothetical protein
MLVMMETHGGYAAGIRRAPIVVDASTLSPEAREELARLVEAVQSNSAQPERDSRRMRDAMSYTITITDNDRDVVLEADDGAMPSEFADLRRWLQRHALER